MLTLEQCEATRVSIPTGLESEEECAFAINNSWQKYSLGYHESSSTDFHIATRVERRNPAPTTARRGACLTCSRRAGTNLSPTGSQLPWHRCQCRDLHQARRWSCSSLQLRSLHICWGWARGQGHDISTLKCLNKWRQQHVEVLLVSLEALPKKKKKRLL